jgi:hypothetical protein
VKKPLLEDCLTPYGNLSITRELDFLEKLEHELIEGKARWLAEFNESFRNVRLLHLDFDMVVEGSTRGKSGYLFSAILSRTMLPAYAASCFVKTLRGDNSFDAPELDKYVSGLQQYVRDKEAKWSFLIVVHSGNAPRALRERIQSLNSEAIGVALVDVTTMEILHNSSLIGRSAERILPKKWKSSGVDVGSTSQNVPDQAQGRQWSKLAFVFGLTLLGLTFLSFLLSAFLAGSLTTNRGGLVINIGLASVITYWYSRGKYYNRISLEAGGITVQTGRSEPSFAKWSSFDLVSLKHLGVGQFDVRLYKVNNHAEFLSVPVSGVKIDPSGFRWKAMELCGHGMNRYVRI